MLPIANAAVKSGCRSVAFAYNDPVIFLEYAVDVAQACQELGIETVAVSAAPDISARSPVPSSSGTWMPRTIDLKGFTEEFYKRLCSATRLRLQ